jgi:hypothetical protein
MPVRRVLACLVVALASAIGFSSSVLAGAAAYKIEFSSNCNNPAVCFDPAVNPGQSLGGDWGSIRLNADASGTAQFTSATHQTPGVPNGAVHFSLVLTWNTLSSPSAPPGAVASDPNGNYLVITVVNIPSLGGLITPATPGHYAFQGAMFGMPGVNYMLEVNAI